MKNRLLTFAGALAVAALLGKFYAIPALAQAVRAALVQDRDAPARQPYLSTPQFTTFIPTSGNFSGAFRGFTNAPDVPAGKRRVINGVSAVINGGGVCSVTTTWGGGANTTFQTSLFPGNGNSSAAGIAGVQLVQNPGEVVQVSVACPLQATFAQISLTGYDIDIP